MASQQSRTYQPSPRYYQSNEPIILICVFVKISTNQSPRVRSWPWCLHESEIQVQGNQRFFFLAASRLVLAALRLSHRKKKKNLWDQGSGPGLLLFTQRLMYIANCQRIQWSNIMNVWSSFAAYNHHCIYLSQQLLSKSWIVVCVVRTTHVDQNITFDCSLLPLLPRVSAPAAQFCSVRYLVVTQCYHFSG